MFYSRCVFSFSKVNLTLTVLMLKSTRNLVRLAVTKKSRQWPLEHLKLISNHEKFTEFSAGFIDTDFHIKPLERTHKKNILLLLNESDIDDKYVMSKLQNSFISPLHENNCRIIVPFLPGSKNTKRLTTSSGIQRQLLGERTAFLLDLITSLNIKKLHMIIGHGFTCFPAFLFASLTPIPNLVLVNTPPLHKLPQFIYPLKKTFLMVELYERFFGRWLGRRMLKKMKGILEMYHHGCTLTDQQAIHFVKTIHGINYGMIENLSTPFNLSQCNLLTVSNNAAMPFYAASNDKLHEDLIEFLEMVEVFDDNVTVMKDLKDSVLNENVFDFNKLELTKTKRIRKSVFLPFEEKVLFSDNFSTHFVIRRILELLNKNVKT